MKPLATIALAATAMVGGASFAGEQLTSFDGVGSMVLDMVDEPTQMAELAPVAPKEHSRGGQCEETRQALEARVEGMQAEFERDIEMAEMAISQLDIEQIEARVEAAVAPFSMSIPEIEANSHRDIEAVQKEAFGKANAAIEARRHELKAQIAQVKNQHSRKALKQAEKALKRAQEALQH